MLLAVEPGTVIAERFEIERRVGSGGMGSVYHALDRVLGGAVALKVLDTDDEGAAQRFEREARALAEMQHAAVVRYVAHGVTPARRPWLAMEWLDGEDLDARLARGALGVSDSVALGARVADALGAAHAAGIVHRDVKPTNLFLPRGDVRRVTVLDFGIALVRAPAHWVTASGAVVGTPGFMSPEQAKGDRDIDARSDVFALGCVLFECLAGRPAFGGDQPIAVLAKVLFDEVPPLDAVRPGVPRALAALVTRMLSKERTDRPADGREVAIALEAIGEIDTVAAGAPPRSAAPGLAGEQRFVCVVLAGPRVGLDVARAAAAAHGARLEALVDGARVIVLDGLGVATDLAARAARCALAIRAAQSDAAVVVATGRAVLGGPSPVGDAIDRAARLLREGSAMSGGGPAGAVLTEEVTDGLLDARFERTGRPGPLALRGERPADEVRTVLGRSAPFVGRDREMALLLGAYDECVAEPLARVVLVTAPAGFGKSRLRLEFVRALRARDTHAEIWTGRGDPMSAGSAFALAASALRTACGMRDGEPLEARCRKLAERGARHAPTVEARRIAEFLGELSRTPFDDSGSVQLRAARGDPLLMGDQIMRAWCDWIDAESTAHPVVMLLEDLQWGDLPSVKLVDAVLRRLPERPLLVVAFARPEVESVFSGLWAERRLQPLPLEPLTRRASARLVRAVLGESADDPTVDRIVDRAGGHAFYVEELIRAHAEGRGDRLPETVLAMVHARLAELPAASRRVLRAGAVFGQTFWRNGLLALLADESAAGDLDAWLIHLAEREWVLPRSDSRFPGEPEHGFAHALVREAAYATLTAGDLAPAHRAAGTWLEARGESDALVLAEHFERGGEPGRAVDWYRRAAEQALEGNDLAGALERAERGVRCGAAGQALGALRLVQAEAHVWRGELVEAEVCGRSAMDALPAGSAAWYAAAAEVAHAAGARANRPRLVELVAALEAAAGPDVSGAEIAACARLARQLLFAGRPDLARRLRERIAGAPAATLERDPVAAGRIRYTGGLVALFAGDPAHYLRECEAALGLFELGGDLRNACAQQSFVGYGLMEVGRYADAERRLRDTVQRADRMGLPPVAAHARHNLGLVLHRLGADDEARRVEEEAVVELARQGDMRLAGFARVYLARILAASGDLGGAEREARAALRVLEAVPSVRPAALAVLGHVLAAAGRGAEAAEAADEAILMMTSAGVEEGEALVRLVQAESLHARGLNQAALAAITAARAQLLARAALISDDALKRSFLESVPEHVRTLRLAEEWKGA